MEGSAAHHLNVPGGVVVTQWVFDGKHVDLNGIARAHAPSGDPDKVLVDILVPSHYDDNNTGEKNLLDSPVTFGRELQHGTGHATFRYVGEPGPTG